MFKTLKTLILSCKCKLYSSCLKPSLGKISIFLGMLLFLASCKSVKRVAEDEHLLVKNKVLINGKKNRSETIHNLISQKPNSRGIIAKLPFRLYLYNWAKPNSDSILDARLQEKLEAGTFYEKLLSKKQLTKWYDYKKGVHNTLRNIGEAPVVYNPEKARKTTNQIKAYHFNQGWFNAEVTHSFEEIKKQKGMVTYQVETGTPYSIDSISTKIATAKIDSVYQKTKENSFIKKGAQYKTSNFEQEQDRLTTELRNSGFYHFNQDYVFFEMDTIGNNHKVNVEVQLNNRAIRENDSTIRKPFNIFRVKEVNIFTDDSYENRNMAFQDTTRYNGFNIYSLDKLKYRPKTLTDAVFIEPNGIFRNLDRSRTYRAISNLNTFKYPNIEYIETDSTSLVANVFLAPRKKYSVGFDFDVSQSNIQTVGFAFSTSLLTRNIFKGAETLELSAIGSIGASKDASDSKDHFFDINEIGADLKLTIPRLFSPFNTEKIIPRYMAPMTRMSLSATSQRNIGLDKQTFNGIFNYRWNPSRYITNRMDLFNIQYVRNLNVDNYFGVYQNSFSRLNAIAREVGYVGIDETLGIPNQADTFIQEALSPTPPFSISQDQVQTVNNINERKERLTEDNLIFATNFSLVQDKRENLLDKSFYILRLKLELAGNLFSGISRALNLDKNASGKYELFNVAYSQYVKTEIDYIKHWHLGGDNIIAMRNYFGFAIPYGNSTSIPFLRSFYAGGPNDNRAWTAYNLGPGSTNSNDEFNEANLKLALSLEYRYNIFNDLNGALFIDAGNIWNALDDVADPRATFDGIKSLKDTAVGAGFGLRYDFGFVVARFDIGFKAYNPNFLYNNSWFNQFNFKNAVYNIGINYPF